MQGIAGSEKVMGILRQRVLSSHVWLVLRDLPLCRSTLPASGSRNPDAGRIRVRSEDYFL